MQAALPVTVADRVASWRRPLEKHLASLDHLGEQVEVLQFAGPVGLRDKPEGVADRVARLMAEDLDLVYTPNGWHTDRDNVVVYGQFLTRLSGSLGKMGQDIVLAAQSEIGEIELAAGGGSSAMLARVGGRMVTVNQPSDGSKRPVPNGIQVGYP